MKKFKVEVQELLLRIVTVEAIDEDEAYQQVRNMYRNEEIVLDSFDYVDTEIEVVTNI